MGYKELSEAQVEHFMEKGWLKVEGVIPYETAVNVENIIWENLELQGYKRNDPTTWARSIIRLTQEKEDIRDFPGTNSERLSNIVEDLVGEGRLIERDDIIRWGNFPTNLNDGANKPWDVPLHGWHYDGNFFRHFVDSPEQGLLLLGFFTDTKPLAGGTLVAEGTHNIVAKMLADHPEGLEHREAIHTANQHPYLAALVGNDNAETEQYFSQTASSAVPKAEHSPAKSERIERFMHNIYHDSAGDLRVVEMTGQRGDLVLCHPFVYHASSQNHGGRPRTICNKVTPLKERMNFDRKDASQYSPIEQSIRQAIQN